MKKMICLTLAFIIVFGMVGCATDPVNNTDVSVEDEKPSASVGEEEQAPPSTDVVEEEEEKEEKEEYNTWRVPAKEIYLTYPSTWMIAERSLSTLLMQTDECLVGVCYDWHRAFDGNLESLIAFFSPRFINDAYAYCKGNISTAEIEVKQTKEAKIGNYTGLNFSGTVSNNKGEWDCHVYGYTVRVEETSLMIVGLVSTKAQDAQMISDIDALTDQIAASIRTEE